MSTKVEVDDLWLASFLIAQGAKLAAIAVLPYSNRRLTAVFALENVCEQAIKNYADGDPDVKIHSLRAALNELRDAMHRELSAKNGKPQIKEMPNGKRRVVENEDTPGNNRSDQSVNRFSRIHPAARQTR
ncbi:MAG: hypothetical protein ACRD4B_09990 [Acidobacteriota bacterium]